MHIYLFVCYPCFAIEFTISQKVKSLRPDINCNSLPAMGNILAFPPDTRQAYVFFMFTHAKPRGFHSFKGHFKNAAHTYWYLPRLSFPRLHLYIQAKSLGLDRS